MDNMKFGYRCFDGSLYSYRGSKDEIRATECSVLIRNCTAVPRDMQPMVREVHNLLTPVGERRMGKARSLMKSVCAEADASNISLLLLVSEDGRDKLVELYSSIGFETVQNDDNAYVMIRNPQVAEAVA